MTKKFHIGDLVSVGTGYLMPPNGIGGVYQLLNHLTGDNLMTHQLPMAAKQMQHCCQPCESGSSFERRPSSLKRPYAGRSDR